MAPFSATYAWADLEKILGGGEPSIVGIKVVQFNVLLELQLITSLVISQIPVESVNTRVGKSHIWEGTAPSGPPLNPPMHIYIST